MNMLIIGLVSFFGGILSALGMGGGGILLIYLTAYAGVQQQTAQGMNLIFFIPIAIVAIVIHAKHKLIRWKVAFLCWAIGLAGVWLGVRLALTMDSRLLGKMFGGFLLLIGFRELFSKPSQSEKSS